MKVIATLPNSDDEFTALDIVNASKTMLKKGFSPSMANQMLLALIERGLAYKSRRGGYRFAVPLLSGFINRQGWDLSTLRAAPSSG